MTPPEQRNTILEATAEACQTGASLEAAAVSVGLSARTLRNWRAQGAGCRDRRPEAIRPAQVHALRKEERQRIVEVANSPEFASLTPEQIAIIMIDRGDYIGSASSIHRVLKEAKLMQHRGKARESKRKPKPPTRAAEKPNQIWAVDITYLPTNTTGRFLKLYMILDLFSRDIMGWEVFEEENGENSKAVMHRAMIAQGACPEVLHADNGSPLKNANLHAMLLSRGITPSHSRARVSNDNAHAEALFRTVKYHPSLPEKPFEGLADARQWVRGFVQWYRYEHRHKSLNMVTPAQKHAGEDVAILAQRKANLEAAKAAHPRRWIGDKAVRSCAPSGCVTINSIRPDTRKIERELKKVA